MQKAIADKIDSITARCDELRKIQATDARDYEYVFHRLLDITSDAEAAVQLAADKMTGS